MSDTPAVSNLTSTGSPAHDSLMQEIGDFFTKAVDFVESKVPEHFLKTAAVSKIMSAFNDVSNVVQEDAHNTLVAAETAAKPVEQAAEEAATQVATEAVSELKSAVETTAQAAETVVAPATVITSTPDAS